MLVLFTKSAIPNWGTTKHKQETAQHTISFTRRPSSLQLSRSTPSNGGGRRPTHLAWWWSAERLFGGWPLIRRYGYESKPWRPKNLKIDCSWIFTPPNISIGCDPVVVQLVKILSTWHCGIILLPGPRTSPLWVSHGEWQTMPGELVIVAIKRWIGGLVISAERWHILRHILYI